MELNNLDDLPKGSMTETRSEYWGNSFAKTDDNHKHEAGVIDKNTNTVVEMSNATQVISGNSIPKKRSLHMDTKDCFEHAESEDGRTPLTNPPLPKTQVAKYLNPVSRKRHVNIKVKAEQQWEINTNNSNIGRHVTASQGFVSVTDMYNIKSNHKSGNINSEIIKNQSAPKQNYVPSVMMAAKNSKRKPDKELECSKAYGFNTPVKKFRHTVSDDVSKFSYQDSSQKMRSDRETSSISKDAVYSFSGSKMYSPLKRDGMSNVIFLSDSSPTNSLSSQSSRTSTPEMSLIAEKPGTKQFFSAENELYEHTKKEKQGICYKLPYEHKDFVELPDIRTGASKYFETDSFDMNAAFGSDSEDFTEESSRHEVDQLTTPVKKLRPIVSAVESPCSSSGSSQKLKSVEGGNSTSKETVYNSSSSKSYSPIKRFNLSNVIYISGSSPESSQGCQTSISESSLKADKSCIKQQLSTQNELNAQPKKERQDIIQHKSHYEHTSFVTKAELSNIKTETAKYFENDSFDMNAAFGSDAEDFTENDGSSMKVRQSNTQLCDKYGLLGTGNYPKASSVHNQDQVNYFVMLPPEILENIFCALPMLDLCLNSNRVCKRWNSVIANDKFLPWKKFYHKLKKDVGNSREDVQVIMKKNGMTTSSTFLASLIRYMKDFKPITAGNMLECLQKHSRYQWAKALIDERLQDCCDNEQPNPWSVITILIILSDDVYTVQEIIQCLTVSWSQCTSREIIECLYCVATFLYAFKLAKRADVWNGMHYRLFYALYLYENASLSSCGDLQSLTSSSTGQQSLGKNSSSSDSVSLTHEQMRIVKHQTKADEVIKIVAFAGTGKTTTLVKYTQLRPDKRFLLVVYNKSVCDYAKTKFPHNVTCKTGHALAFQVFGRRYSSKLYGIKVYTLTQTLKPRKGENLYIQAKNVLSTLENYFASSDRYITMQHVPNNRIDDKTGHIIPIEPSAKIGYVKDAQYIWGRMQDLNEKKLCMSHDGYLKLYQLSRPCLPQYDCILIDEAQDLTPAITDILLSQPQGKILVGDPHQQIYSFRGAVNAMDTVRADTIFYLTQSFRFGPEIAQVASNCLEILKHEKKTLVGSERKCTVMGDKVGQLAIISRCNFRVFSEAVKKCCYSDEQCKVAFVGGTKNFGFPMIMDMYALSLPASERAKEGCDIKNKFIKMFSTFTELENFATKSIDKELLGKIKIVKTYRYTLPICVSKIESKCVPDIRQADYVFSTAHKAKGLEFSSVRVTDDFLVDHQPSTSLHFDLNDGPVIQINTTIRIGENDSDEGNLLYVAVTRAKNALQMSPTLLRILNQAGEKFEFPTYSESLRLAGKTFKCKMTDEEFKPMVLTLEKRSVKRGDGVELSGGLYSPVYLSEDLGSFSQLMGLTEGKDKEGEKKQKQVPAGAFYVG